MNACELQNQAIGEYQFIELINDFLATGKIPLMGLGYNADDELCVVSGQYVDGEFAGLLEKKITLKEACAVKAQMDYIRDEFDEHSNCFTPDARRKFWDSLHESLD